MANLIAVGGSGNFTTAGSWQTVDTAGEVDSELGTVAISTSNIDSPTFTPAATAIDAVALKLAARIASPTGTFTVTLRNSTAGSDALTLTVNVADLHVSGLGWVTFKFASTTTPNGTDSYIVRVVCSSTGSQVTLQRSTSGTNNFSKKIRQTTTQAPASGNHLVIANELTGAGTSNSVTMTMDNTATTSFGPTVSGGPPQGMVISAGAVLAWGTSTSTSYYLKLKGVLLICAGGIMRMGSSGTHMPSSSTAILEFDAASAVDSGLEVRAGGTYNAYGFDKTTQWTLMTANKVATNTVIALAATTDWANSDELCFAPTGTSASEWEKKTITSVDSSTQVTLSAGLTSGHSGTSPSACEVGNLTRNVKIRGVDSTHQGYIFVTGATAAVVMQSTECYFLGSGTSAKRGIDVWVGCAFSAKWCTFHDYSTSGWGISHQSGAIPILNIDTCIFYIMGRAFVLNQVAAGGWGTIKGCLMIGLQEAFAQACTIQTDGTTDVFRDNVVAGYTGSFGTMMLFGTGSSGADFAPDRTNWQGNIFHHAGATLLAFTTVRKVRGTFYNWKMWSVPNTQTLFAMSDTTFEGLTYEGCEFFSGGSSINFQGRAVGYINFVNCTMASSTQGQTTSSFYGIVFNGGYDTFIQLFLDGCDFGVTSGTKSGHGTADIGWANSGRGNTLITCRGVNLASTTKLTGLTANAGELSYIVLEKYGNTAADHRGFFRYGNSTRDTNNHLAVAVTSNLVARYAIAEGSGQVLNDATGVHSSAVLGATSGPESSDPAWSATGLDFTTNDYCNLGGLSSYPFNTESTSWTFVCVLKRTAASGVGQIFQARKTSSPNQGFDVGLASSGNGNFLFVRITGDDTTQETKISTIAIPADSNWRMIMVSYNGSTKVATVYVKSTGHTANETLGAFTKTFSNTTGNLDIGGFGSWASSSFLEGSIGYVMIYDTNLNSTNASDLYTWLQSFIVNRGASSFGTAPSALTTLKLTPNSATVKFAPSVRRYPINSGATVTISVSVRKSTVGDENYQSQAPANYNGNQPRLILKRNAALGFTSDTVLDTMSVGNGAWETLTGTTGTATDDGVLEFYVDCDGTAGYINVGSWSIS